MMYGGVLCRSDFKDYECVVFFRTGQEGRIFFCVVDSGVDSGGTDGAYGF